MKLLVTGSNGFIGKNLIAVLKEKDVEIITYDINDDFTKIEDNIDSIDFIYHLAGINRPLDNKEFYEGNTNLTKRIIDLLKTKNKETPILVTSSIQAVLDNDYGKSKKEAEEYMLDNYKYSIIYRLHNVFGKWCMPNYNSVVATFCYNIANNLDIQINDESKELELIYIDDIVKQFVSCLDNPVYNEILHISPVYNVTLGYIAELIRSFKESTIYVPKTGDAFIKKLYATYISYAKKDELVISTKMNIDERGSFTELVKTPLYGQFSVSTSKPGIVRGNHYHHTKMERFIVVKGQAKITFKHIVTSEIIEFYVDDKNIKIVTIPVGYTHKIENISNEEMILFIWCNEIFDPNSPDTYFKEIGD